MTLIEITKNQNGYVSASQATAAGIPRRKLAEAVERGDLVQVERGLYTLPETWEDPYFIAQHRFSRGVFSDDTALFLIGYTMLDSFMRDAGPPEGKESAWQTRTTRGASPTTSSAR